MVKAYMGGHRVIFKKKLGRWVFAKTQIRATKDTPACKLCKVQPQMVAVMRPAHLSHTGKACLDIVQVDACIADLVRRLNAGATEPITAASCCGHGKSRGSILLADGRRLEIFGRLKAKKKRKKKRRRDR